MARQTGATITLCRFDVRTEVERDTPDGTERAGSFAG
jgi:hypothetical protein